MLFYSLGYVKNRLILILVEPLSGLMCVGNAVIGQRIASSSRLRGAPRNNSACYRMQCLYLV
jgi:hypothetical protein